MVKAFDYGPIEVPGSGPTVQHIFLSPPLNPRLRRRDTKETRSVDSMIYHRLMTSLATSLFPNLKTSNKS